jgi:hypothetical protein
MPSRLGVAPNSDWIPPERTCRALSTALFVCVIAWPAAARAEETGKAAAAESPSNEDCLSCHTDPGTTREDGKPVLVDAAKWQGSIHGDVSVQCVDCHADLAKAELPHADHLAPAQCGSCHQKPVAQHAAGIHSTPRKDGKGMAAGCQACHGPAHEILASGDRRSPTNHLNLVETCARCHDDPKIIAAAKLPSGIVGAFMDSIHGRALKKAGLVVAPACSTCHGAHDIRPAKDPKSAVNRHNQPETCGKCHEGIAEKYATSIHAAVLAKGAKKAPVCADCHTAHGIQRADSDWALDVMQECGTCHKQSLGSYRDTFHGRVTQLGFTRTAKCADCHGAHDIVSKTDPRSRVAGANRVTTCKQCHPTATPSFAKYDPHANAHEKKRSVPLYYTALFMKALLFGVIGFFGLHTVLWLGRGVYDLRNGRGGPPKGEL